MCVCARAKKKEVRYSKQENTDEDNIKRLVHKYTTLNYYSDIPKKDPYKNNKKKKHSIYTFIINIHINSHTHCRQHLHGNCKFWFKKTYLVILVSPPTQQKAYNVLFV